MAVRRETIVIAGLPVVAVVVSLAATLSASPQWSWRRAAPLWAVSGALTFVFLVVVVWAPHLKMSRRRVSVALVTRTVGPLTMGPFLDRLLAIEVSTNARGGLSNCAARLTSIERNPPLPPQLTPSPPIRLHWTPSHAATESIPAGGDDAIEIVRFMAGTTAEVHSLDEVGPWTIDPGDWTIELRLTADGYKAAHFRASFSFPPNNVGVWVGVAERL